MQLSSTFSPTIQFPKIRTKLVSVITLLIGAISLFIFFYFPARLENQAIRATAAKAQSITEMTAFSVSPALYFEDRKDAEEILEGAGQSRDLAYIIVVDGSGNVFADFNRSEADQARFAQVEDDASDGDIYRTMAPILHNDVEIGKLYSGLSLRELRAEVDRSRRATGSVSLIIFIVGMIAVFGISTIVTGPLRHMVGTVEEITKGDLTHRATVFSDDEVGHLAKAFNLMVDNLEFAYGELEDVNRSLEKRVEERTKALQQEIVERKRMEEEIKASLSEKEVLLREIHHRVKNNLQIVSSLLDLSSMQADSQGAIGLLADARARIYTMALIHSQLYQSEQLDRIEVGKHIRELVSYLSALYTTRRGLITAVVEPSDVYLSVVQAIPCALALSEVISNAFKHAFKEGERGRIDISVQRSGDDAVLLCVRDDGVGMPQELDIDTTSSLGLKLVRNLVQDQLKGKLQIKRGVGTEVVMEFRMLEEETDTL